ncbi:nuclear transport factor 2 family protein [Streptomyces sp. NPDC058249]|uniref:nuclear transport factor 2 family protein n=1 Tax=Streptomyces sp. NPDC058249 TaxID=3346403 RepID=UPI0036ED0D16
MSDATQIVETYFKAWNDFDAESRKAMLESIFAKKAKIIDPDWVAEDRDAIVEAIGAARGKLGDLPLDLTTIIGSHHDVVLYTWHLGPAAEPVAKGYGVLHINDGVVETAYNFFG